MAEKKLAPRPVVSIAGSPVDQRIPALMRQLRTQLDTILSIDAEEVLAEIYSRVIALIKRIQIARYEIDQAIGGGVSVESELPVRHCSCWS